MFSRWKRDTRDSLLDESPVLDKSAAEPPIRRVARGRVTRERVVAGRGPGVRRALMGTAGLVALALGLAVPVLTQTAAATGTGPVSWGALAVVDTARPYVEPNQLNSVSCASSSACVGVSSFGDIVSSSNATGTTASDWKVLPSSLLTSDATGYSLDSIACTSSSCIAGGSAPTGGPAFLTSTTPTGGQSSDWTATTISDSNTNAYSIAAVQCPSSSVCYALDSSGDLLSYNGTSWTLQNTASGTNPAVHVNASSSGVAGFSCPTTGFCVAIDDSGEAYISPTGLATETTASGLATPWTGSATGLSFSNAVSCTSSSDCTVVGSATTAPSDAYTTDASGSSPTWNAGTASFFGIPGTLDCFATGDCLVGSFGQSPDSGSLYASTNSGQSFSSVSGFPSSLGQPSALGCFGTSLCVSGTSDGYITNSTTPSSSATTSTWSAGVQVTPGLDPVALSQSSCPSAVLCVGTDGQGRVITGTPGSFAVGSVTGAFNLGPPVCAGASLCLATDHQGDIYSSANPAAGASSWAQTATAIGGSGATTGPQALTALACPSATLCVGGGSFGDMFASTSPATSSWSESSSAIDSNGIGGIACASSSLCVGYSSFGDDNLFATTTPSNPSSWSVASAIGRFGTSTLTCASGTTTCVGFDYAGDVLSSTNPAGGTSAWNVSAPLILNGNVVKLDCPSSSLCVGYTFGNQIVSSSDPAGGASNWTVTQLPVSVGAFLSGVACPSASLCLATDTAGNVYESTDPTGGASSWTAVSLDSGNGFQSLACDPTGAVCALADTAGGVVEGVLASSSGGGTTTGGGATTTGGGSGTTTGGGGATTGGGGTTTGTSGSGSAGGASAPTTGTALATTAKVSGRLLSVRLSCSGAASVSCAFTERLTIVERLRGSALIGVAARAADTRASKRRRKPPRIRRRVVTVGSESVTISGGTSRIVKLALNGLGMSLLERRKTLPVRLEIRQGSRMVHAQTVTFRQPRPKKKKKR